MLGRMKLAVKLVLLACLTPVAPVKNYRLKRDYKNTGYKKSKGYSNFKGKTICFIGINPATPEETGTDPTTKRLVTFVEKWGAKGFRIRNLFSYVSPYPEDLEHVKDPVGTNNNVEDFVKDKSCDVFIPMWGRYSKVKGNVKKLFRTQANHLLRY